MMVTSVDSKSKSKILNTHFVLWVSTARQTWLMVENWFKCLAMRVIINLSKVKHWHQIAFCVHLEHTVQGALKHLEIVHQVLTV